nr:MAG TPA: replisome organizer [Caudoviricetes sp.]
MWAKIDDKLWMHPKWVSLPDSAKALWVSALSYCACYETDGHVPSKTLSILCPNKRHDRVANLLIKCGLWEPIDGGYVFHDWERYQPTKARKDAERKDKRDRMRALRARSVTSNRRVTDSDVTSKLLDPVPVPEVAKATYMGGASANAEDPAPTKRRTRKTRLPDNWQPNPEHHATAHRLHLDLDSEAEDFRNHAQAQGRRLADWDAGFRSWLKKSAEYAQERQGAYRNQAATTSERVQGWIELGQQFAQNPRKEIRA